VTQVSIDGSITGSRWRARRAPGGGHERRRDAPVGGGLDPGYPLPGKIRQAQFALPRGADWKGLKLKAEIEVKGGRHPVRWACHQALEEDGSLRLRPTRGLG